MRGPLSPREFDPLSVWNVESLTYPPSWKNDELEEGRVSISLPP